MLRAELAKEDTVEQPGIALGSPAPSLRRKDELVAAVGEQPPGHRDLGRVEVTVGQWNQDAHGKAAPA